MNGPRAPQLSLRAPQRSPRALWKTLTLACLRATQLSLRAPQRSPRALRKILTLEGPRTTQPSLWAPQQSPRALWKTQTLECLRATQLSLRAPQRSPRALRKIMTLICPRATRNLTACHTAITAKPSNAIALCRLPTALTTKPPVAGAARAAKRKRKGKDTRRDTNNTSHIIMKIREQHITP